MDKSQSVRLLDVAVFGPFMLYLAMKGNMNAGDRFTLGLVGVGTIFYNWHNYRKTAEKIAAEVSIVNAEGVRG